MSLLQCLAAANVDVPHPRQVDSRSSSIDAEPWHQERPWSGPLSQPAAPAAAARGGGHLRVGHRPGGEAARPPGIGLGLGIDSGTEALGNAEAAALDGAAGVLGIGIGAGGGSSVAVGIAVGAAGAAGAGKRAVDAAGRRTSTLRMPVIGHWDLCPGGLREAEHRRRSHECPPLTNLLCSSLAVVLCPKPSLPLCTNRRAPFVIDVSPRPQQLLFLEGHSIEGHQEAYRLACLGLHADPRG